MTRSDGGRPWLGPSDLAVFLPHRFASLRVPRRSAAMPPRRGKENAVRGACDAPVLVLRATGGPCKGAVFDEQVERRRIGRGPKGNTVCLKDASVSQRHAEVVWTGAAWTVTDLGSSNGTFVRLTGQHALAPGEMIRLGDELLRFEIS